MRIGSENDWASVAFETVDVSAKAGAKYGAMKGRLEFESGELVKSISIPIVDDEFWDATLEFHVQLSDPFRCTLGTELWKTRVIVLDDDMFPSKVYKREILSGSEDALAAISVRLLMTFIRFVFLRVPAVWWKATLTLMVDQLWNVYYIMTIFMKIYLVDVILNVSDPTTSERCLVPGNRYLSAIAFALLWVAPNFLLLAIGRLKVGPLDMCKSIRQHFQVNLFRKYMNFTEDSKREVPIQDLTTTMDVDIPMLVDDGFMCVFDIAQGLGKILVVACFMVLQDPRCLVALFLFPTVMLLFLKSRQEQDVELESKLIAAEAGATGIVVNTFESFHLIRDYGVRHAMTYRYESSLSKSKSANDNMICFKYWNAQLVPWLTLLCVGVNLALGAEAVLIGKMSVGSFLAMVQIYQEVGSRFQGMYESLAAGMQAGSPLCGLTRMLNLPTDMLHRLGQTNARRKYMLDRTSRMVSSREHTEISHTGTSREPTEVRESEGLLARSDPNGTRQPNSNDDGESPFDKIPVSIVGLSVDYIGSLSNVHATVQPGSLVFITGSHATGKATLVNFLADIFVPERGRALFSAHNRCLHVSKTPEIMPQLTLYQNLTFGASEDNPALVRSVIRRLGLDTHWILEELQREIITKDPGFSNEKLRQGATNTWSRDLDAAPPEDSCWTKRLSHREKRMVSLARGLLCNPEILLLQKPLDDCDLDDVERILGVLREFVDNRGINKNSSGRPRTVFFSGGTFMHSTMPFEMSDVIWNLHNDHGLIAELGGNGQQSHGHGAHGGNLSAAFGGAIAGTRVCANANLEVKLLEGLQRRPQLTRAAKSGGRDGRAADSRENSPEGEAAKLRMLSSPRESPRQIKMNDAASSPKSARSAGSTRSKEIARNLGGGSQHRINRHKEFFGRQCTGCTY